MNNSSVNSHDTEGFNPTTALAVKADDYIRYDGDHEHSRGNRQRSNCWHISWGFFLLVTLAGQAITSYYAIQPLIHIFSNVSYWPLYDYGEEAEGIFAIGNKAYGIVAIGQQAYGVVAIGQFAFGLIAIGQIGCGVLFALCQVGGALAIAVAQVAVATKVPLAQIGLGLWNVGKVQLGFNLLSSWMAPYNDFVVKCVCCNKGKSKVYCTAYKLMSGLRFPSYWPQEGRDWMATSIRERDTEDVIREYVMNAAKGGYHNLDQMNEEEKEMVIQRLIRRKRKFKRIAMRNFTVNTITAV